MTAQLQQQQMQPHTAPDYAERLVRVEKDVAGLTAGLASLTGSVERGFAALTSDVKARSTINWQPIAILLGVLGSIGTMGFTWINTGQGRLELAIAKVEASAQRYVPREDLDTRFNVVTQRRDDLQRLTDGRVERVERDLDAVTKQVVPRGEHEQMWAAQRARDADLQRQADQVRQGLYDLNTPRDTIQGMQKRIDELERDARAPARR
ncbi:hypothetical protein MKK84_27075 [Methylobacterium sp. E-065]|uniref:hypothetical protein n=1 Tax=Methylobacterium sp. E-065 TaxID=2836583 RepID=UPI001FB98F35|nr:hypothetical protein [Methylobacterium sp. E-065]MCJ2021041.1 hypothetical protein [Methylobacterium sp. E-065]